MLFMYIFSIVLWFAGFFDHRYSLPQDLVSSPAPFRLLQIVPRSDGKMALRGMVFQVSAYLVIVGTLIGTYLVDKELQGTFNSVCIVGLVICQGLLYLIIKRIFR